LKKINDFPEYINKDIDIVIDVFKRYKSHGFYGSKSGNAAASTVLHFLYPDIVPIIDINVLQAIGYSKEQAKKNVSKIDIYKLLINHIWELASRYANSFESFQESPIRLIDMALWVVRGN
ncbi:MAG: hypothetical protein ACP5I1_11645, partial [Candidatus Hinthialibacter sp.]